MINRSESSSIKFKSHLFKIGEWIILLLPMTASKLLPSRGMTLVEGTINNKGIKAVLEPDGRGSHWFRIDEGMCKSMNAKDGDTVELEIRPSTDWPEPIIPTDLKNALSEATQSQKLWTEITPAARWDWIRWIRSTKNPDTRAKRIRVTMSKLKAGTRRPCCFNRSVCTEPYVSNQGLLLVP